MSNLTVWGVLPEVRTPLLPTRHHATRNLGRRASDRRQPDERVPLAQCALVADGSAPSQAARQWGERHAGIALVEQAVLIAIFTFFAVGLIAIITMS